MHERLLRLAYSKLPTHDQPYRHYAFIVQSGEVLSLGRNHTGDGVVIYKRGKIHAEYVAFRKAQHRIHKGFECYNIRIGRDMATRCSKPCRICFNFLKAHGCTKVHYTITDGLWGCLTL